MKKHFIAFMMPFLTLATGFAQEAAQDVPVKQDTKEISYWTDPASGDKRLLNKSKFRDNWFVGLQGRRLLFLGTHTSSSGFFDQFRPAGALSIGKWIAPAGGIRLQGFYGSNAGRASNDKPYYWDAMGVGLDGLFNFTNLFCGYEEDRTFNLIGILGAGYEHTANFSKRTWNDGIYNTESQDLLSIRLGLMAKFRLGKAWDFNLEITNSLLDDSFDGWEGEGSNDRWMAMSTYWQVSATVSKIITAHGNSPTPAATCRNMTKQTPKSTACVKPTKRQLLLSQRLRQKWWKAIISVRLSRLTMLPPQSTNYRK